MTTDFITIQQAREALKGSIKAIVTHESDLKAGTTNGKDWTKKVFTLEDTSGSIELTTWGDDTKKFKVGYTYEIVNPWWKEYKGEPQLDLGKYATVTIVGSDKAPEENKPSPEAVPSTPEPQQEQISLYTINEKLERIHDMVEPLFKKMIDEQLKEQKK